jgi:uncharacterized protein YbbK (DUF523 family)
MKVDHPKVELWLQEGRMIAFCPEVEGGLPTPRPPAEIMDGDGVNVLNGTIEVLNINGVDVTKSYLLGAQKALQVAQANGVKLAILKARSPSCGKAMIYDGSFSNTLKSGKGVTAALLEQNGIRVFNEEEIEKADSYLSGLNTKNP